MNKNLWRWMGCFLLVGCLLLPVAQAEEKTVVPLPSALELDQLAGLTLLATPGAYDPETEQLFLTLWEPMAFSHEQVLSLAPGDCLALGEERLLIVSVDWNDFGCAVCAKDDWGERELFFFPEGECWLPTEYGSLFWHKAGEVAASFAVQASYLEGIVPEDGEPLEEPLSLPIEAFLRRKAIEESDETAGPGFGCRNTKVTFDENGQIVQIQRDYVPWQ